MELKDRVKLYCDHKNIAISTFEKMSGLSNGYFNSVKKRPSQDKLRGILDCFNDINPIWLMTGEGNMLRTDTASVITNTNNQNTTINDTTLISALTEQLRIANEQLKQANEQLREKDKQISQLFELLTKK